MGAMVGVLPPWDDDDPYDSAKRLLRQMTLRQQTEARVEQANRLMQHIDEVLAAKTARGYGYGLVPTGWEPHGVERVSKPADPPLLPPGKTRCITLDDD